MTDTSIDIQFLQEVYDVHPQAIIWKQPIWDQGGKTIVDFAYRYSNEEGLNYLKLTRKSFEGVTICNSPTLTDELRIRVLQELIDIFHSGENSSYDVYNPALDRYARVLRTRLRGGVLSVIQDISSEQRVIRELEQTVKALERSNHHLEDFAYAASHDLKEPIRKIHFFADQLRSELGSQLSERQHQLFNRLDNATTRMGNLIDDLLSYSRAARGSEEKEEIDLNQKVANVLEELELEIQQKGAHIEVGPLPVVRGNKSQLRQLFQNLITNALKYSREGSEPRIGIRSETVRGDQSCFALPEDRRATRFHHLRVQDNGIGFEQKDAERIFHVFTRLHGNAEYKGTGVGLAIAQKVVENHQGFIRAESAPGQGATFHILLPATDAGRI